MSEPPGAADGVTRRARRVRVAVLAAAAVLMLVGIQWGLPNVESWNGDDIAPEKPLRVVHDWLHGWHKYPYLHWWLNALLYAPYLALLGLLGQLDLGCFPRIVPHCFAAPTRDLTVLMLASRLLSVAMGLGTVVGTERLARALGAGRGAALAAAAVCAGSATLVALSHTANLDVPAAFWFTWSLVAAVHAARSGSLRDHLAFGALAGCAISTKDAVAGAYVLPGLALLAAHVRSVARERGTRGVALARAALLDRRFFALALLPLAIFAAVQNALGNPAGLVEHVRFWVDGSPVLDRYRAKGAGHLAWRTWLGLEAGLGAPMAGLALACLGLAPLRDRRLWLLWLPIASYGALSLAPNFVEPRLLLPLLPLLAVASGVCIAAAARGPRLVRALVACVFAAALAHELGVAVNAVLHALRDPRYEAERWLADHVEPDARVAALGASEFMPRLERLGLAPVWFEPAQIAPRALEAAASFDFAILTTPYHPLSDKAWQQALRSGKAGGTVVFDAQPRTPLDRWFGTRLRPGLVHPRITVVALR